jgi:hypothetical protein
VERSRQDAGKLNPSLYISKPDNGYILPSVWEISVKFPRKLQESFLAGSENCAMDYSQQCGAMWSDVGILTTAMWSDVEQCGTGVTICTCQGFS